MPDVLVFDLFDTLVDLRREELPVVEAGDGPTPSTVGALWRVVRAAKEIELADFAAVLRESDRTSMHARWAEGREIRTEERFTALVDRLGLPVDGLVEELTATHVGWLAKVASTPPHHRRVLEQLRTRCRLAICSNFSHTPTALSILERDGLRDLFDAVVISADVGLRKPRREIFEHTLRAMGARPAQTWHVGDQLAKDVAGAAPLGMETVWITRRVTDPAAQRAAYEGPSPTRVVADLGEIDDFVPGTVRSD